MAVTTITKKHTLVNFSNQKITPKYIVWHDTGVRDQSDEGNANYFYSVYRDASANFFIDEDSITEVVAPGYVAWHCGDGKGVYGITNYNSIGIELCAEADGTFKPETIANAVWLGKKLMADWRISYEGNVRHYDASRKNCPQFLNTDGKWSKWYEFKAQLIVAAEMPITKLGNLVYVDYDATIMNGGYSVDSKPWGEPGFENWSNTTDWLYKTIHFREENATREYANGDHFGWVDKRALGKARKNARYTATVISAGFSIDSLPWGEEGYYQLGQTDNHVYSVVTVLMESLSGEYAYIRNDEKEIGWVDKRALIEGVVAKPEVAPLAPVVVKSVLHLPNGKEWVVYPSEGPYQAGDVISLEGEGGESAFTILGERNGGKVLIVELENFGIVSLRLDVDKGAKVEKIYG